MKNIFKNRIYVAYPNGKLRRIFFIRGLNIEFRGENSEVIIHKPYKRFKNSQIVCGNNCKVEIFQSVHKVNGLEVLAQAENSTCTIGTDFSCTNGCKVLLHKEPNLSVTIGNDCMFGSNIILRTSDVHPIYDVNTGECLNYGGNINIGDKCWLAMNVTVLKNVSITNNCIIGTGSIVTKNCEKENSIYAGTPAKLVKTGVTWNRLFK